MSPNVTGRIRNSMARSPKTAAAFLSQGGKVNAPEIEFNLMSYKFQLGQVFSSPGVKAQITATQLDSVLRQHVSGDWSDDCRDANALAARTGGRILSTFAVDGKHGKRLRLWVMTDKGHTRTFVMFPEESAYRASDLEEVPGPLLQAGLLDL